MGKRPTGMARVYSGYDTKGFFELLPAPRAFVFEVDCLAAAIRVMASSALMMERIHVALGSDKGIHQPADDADHQRPEYAGPETDDVKTGDHPGNHFDHQGIDDKGKQTKAENINRQGQ